MAKIDSLRSEKELMQMSPPLSVLVYSDLYRLRGDAADLDTAGMYMAGMVGDHDAVKVYYGQKLSHALKCGSVTLRLTMRLNWRDTLMMSHRWSSRHQSIAAVL